MATRLILILAHRARDTDERGANDETQCCGPHEAEGVFADFGAVAGVAEKVAALEVCGAIYHEG